MSKHKHRKHDDAVILVLKGREQYRFSCELGEKDTVRMRLDTSADTSGTLVVLMEEAEAFFEQVLPLVRDADKRPIAGSLFLDVFDDDERITNKGGRLEISVDKPDSYNADIKLTTSVGEKTMRVDRLALERFLFTALEGFFQDMEDDD